jgi:hypothetical protein
VHGDKTTGGGSGVVLLRDAGILSRPRGVVNDIPLKGVDNYFRFDDTLCGHSPSGKKLDFLLDFGYITPDLAGRN